MAKGRNIKKEKKKPKSKKEKVPATANSRPEISMTGKKKKQSCHYSKGLYNSLQQKGF